MEIVRIPVWVCHSEEADQLPANWPVLVDTWGKDLTHARAGDAICKLDHSSIISYNDPSSDIDEEVTPDPFIWCTTNDGVYINTMLNYNNSDIALDMLARCLVAVATKDCPTMTIEDVTHQLQNKILEVFNGIQKGDILQDIHRCRPYTDKKIVKDTIIYSE